MKVLGILCAALGHTSSGDGSHRWVVRVTDERLYCTRRVSPIPQVSWLDIGAPARLRRA